MALPKVNLGQIQDALDGAFEQFAQPATVTLRDGSTFTVKVSHGFRRDRLLTEGLNQSDERIKIRCTEWDAASPGREPQKGDRIMLQRTSKRFAVQGMIRDRGLGDTSFLYVLDVRA